MITLPPLPLIDGCLVFDNSWLEKFQSCPFEAQLTGINKRIATSHRDGLNFGTAAHTVMSMRYQQCGSNACTDECRDSIRLALAQHFDTNPESAGDHRNLAMAEAFLDAYNKIYKKEPFDILTLPNGKRFVEKSFLSPIGHFEEGHLHPFQYNCTAKDWIASIKDLSLMPILYSGRIDLGIGDSGGEWVVDHKSGFQFGKSFTAEMSSTPQLRGYCWEFKNYFGRLPKGYVINAFRIRPPTKDALYDSSLLFRTDGKDPDFQRIPITITQHDIDAWETDTLGLIEEFMWHYSRGRFNRHKKSCVNKYGLCQYYALCNEVTPEHQESYLASPTFMDNTWSALNTPQQEKANKKI